MAQKARWDEERSLDKVTIIGRNLQVTAAMRDHILLKLHKIEEMTPDVINVMVYLELERNWHKAEILYKFSHFTVVAHATKVDMYQAFDTAAARLKGKLRKWKTQIQDHHGKKPSEVELSIQVLDRKREVLNEINDAIEEETLHEVELELTPPKVMKTKKKSVPMLKIDEAAMRMELSSDHFLVYRSEEDQKLKVMYERRDGTFGILEIE